ncbi:uncharacterized protein MONBRDRAFT_8870 [Monosiga brevicollis MX1]|uniref:Fibronectin type-III domain-containing protein n=1 Tax=Monosiga brevicollis TaxID=81824 RepID=A9V1D3_MONBE|nr:uncharacterized protein MONBRDRAFT_8870 [Monosiga brevicollis MX1]EDQ88546.1 predicted protein [Monosiga brevicollis MX1]|eukprot:XP_001746650.1 hypothetical protein [Monosiga brevicollis MX1]
MSNTDARPFDRAHAIARAPQEPDRHPEISTPVEFEHFLHVGVSNLAEVNELCLDQQAKFQEVVERRQRRLPETPTQRFSDEQHTQRATPKLTPSHASSSSLQSNRRYSRTTSTKMLKAFMRSDSPKSTATDDELRLHIADAIHAVENNQVEKLNDLLKREIIDVNSRDDDEHTLLDLAVMLNLRGAVRLLQLYGGIENDKYTDAKARKTRLEVILRAKQIEVRKILTAIQEGNDRLYQEYDLKNKMCTRAELLFRKFDSNYRKAGVPAAPSLVRLSVHSPTSIRVQIGHVRDHGQAVVTRYKVEWSTDPTFADSQHVFIPSVVESYILEGLVEGAPCYIRVASLNIKGVGPAVKAQPPFIVPSSWRQLDDRPYRTTRLRTSLAAIQDQLMSIGVENDDGSFGASGVPATPSKAKAKLMAKFGSGLKPVRQVKRGLHLAVVAFDPAQPSRVLTINGTPPVVPIEASVSPQETAALVQWIQQLSFDWGASRGMADLTEDVASLQARKRAAEAVACLQGLFNTLDLGLLYHEPIKEDNGALIITAVQSLPQSEWSGISNALSWSDTEGLAVSSTPGGADAASTPARLLSSLSDLVTFASGAIEPQLEGLYLSVLVPRSTVGGLQVTVLKHQAAVLPLVRLRTAHNISRDEWAYLRGAGQNTERGREGTATHGHELLKSIVEQAPAALALLGIPASAAPQWRLYADNVWELSPQASALVLVSPSSEFLTETTHKAHSENRDQLVMPAAWFERLCWQTLDPDAHQQYSRLWLQAGNLASQLQYEARAALGAEGASKRQMANVAAEAQRSMIKNAVQSEGQPPNLNCLVCQDTAKAGKRYCKSCYGVLYKHIKQVIEMIHREGSRFETDGTSTEMLIRLREAMSRTKQRLRRPCSGLTLQLLRMHLTRAVALAEQTVTMYSELDEISQDQDSSQELSTASNASAFAGVATCGDVNQAQATAEQLNKLPQLADILESGHLVPQFVNTNSGPMLVLMPATAPLLSVLLETSSSREEQLRVDPGPTGPHFTSSRLEDSPRSVTARGRMPWEVQECAGMETHSFLMETTQASDEDFALADEMTHGRTCWMDNELPSSTATTVPLSHGIAFAMTGPSKTPCRYEATQSLDWQSTLFSSAASQGLAPAHQGSLPLWTSPVISG